MVNTRLGLISILLLAVASVVGTQAHARQYYESGQVDEPWSGWWWPMFDYAGGGPYMWQGGGGVHGNDPGPIYDLDTRYFWMPQVDVVPRNTESNVSL